MISHAGDDPSDDTADDLRVKHESSSQDDCFFPPKKRKFEVFELPTELPIRPDNVTEEQWFDSSPVTMGPYMLNDFQRMWTDSVRSLSCTDIESTLAIKGANRAIGKCDSGSQKTAQYGRLEAIGLEVCALESTSIDSKWLFHGILTCPSCLLVVFREFRELWI
mmetsp:Transcript_23562/g.42493  ORF Transcript_23562/g.42493 Transcript_23562/m.42493 type:complete len:164 (+) Transcript_23562:89-580(+)